MKDFLLRSKHWVLFIILIIPTVISQWASTTFSQRITKWSTDPAASDFDREMLNQFLSDNIVYIVLFVIVYLISWGVQYGWYYYVARELEPHVPVGTSLRPGLFRWALGITIAGTTIVFYLVFLIFQLLVSVMREDYPTPPTGSPETLILTASGALLLLSLLITVGIIIAVMHVGKIIRSIEMDRPAPGGEYAGYSFLALLLPIGVWMLQPKVQRFLETGNMNEESKENTLL